MLKAVFYGLSTLLIVGFVAETRKQYYVMYFRFRGWRHVFK